MTFTGVGFSGVALFALAITTASCTEQDAPVLPPAELPTLETALLCDAGDGAFVERLIVTLWGRRPASIREVEVLAAVLAQTDRETLVRAMAGSPEYRERWAQFFMDALTVNRVGVLSRPGCYEEHLLGDDDPGLAIYVRDHGPYEGASDAPFTMRDVIESALSLDDLSPLYLAELVIQQASTLLPPKEGDGNLIGEEEATRLARATAFQRNYLNRNMVCVGCHNSTTATTDRDDPAEDRHWPLPGALEKALFGDDTGRPFTDLMAFFRTGGVISVETILRPELAPEYIQADGDAPWGIAWDCGRFVPRAQIEPDPFDMQGYFVAPAELPTVWVLEERLRAGLTVLRGQGEVAESGSADNDGDEAFARLLVMNIVDEVWAELTGRRLTTVNSFPRNAGQNQLLGELARAFAQSGYSLEALVVAITTDPLFNQAAPLHCTGPDSPYHLPPVFDPWTVDLEDPAVRGNSTGDRLRRLPARMLLHSAHWALDWEPLPEFFTGIDQGYQLPEAALLQRDLGAYMKETEMGFRGTELRAALAWEDTYGACKDPGEKAGPDWLQRLLSEAPAGHTVGDALSALKDRLLTDPNLSDPDERELLEALVAAPLDQPLGADEHDETRLRLACGVWMQSPGFVFQDLPGEPPVGAGPSLVAKGSSFRELCEALAPSLKAAGTVSCKDGTLEVAP